MRRIVVSSLTAALLIAGHGLPVEPGDMQAQAPRKRPPARENRPAAAPPVSVDGGTLGHRDHVPTPPHMSAHDPIDVTLPGATRAGDTGWVTFMFRDYECEDGDRIEVQVYDYQSETWNVIFVGELFNQWQTRNVQVTAGYSYTVDVHALNGSGFKGDCDYADANSGEMYVGNMNEDGSGSNWNTYGGGGSRTFVNIHVP